jgi:signal transduction histidine kinase
MAGKKRSLGGAEGAVNEAAVTSLLRLVLEDAGTSLAADRCALHAVEALQASQALLFVDTRSGLEVAALAGLDDHPQRRRILAYARRLADWARTARSAVMVGDPAGDSRFPEPPPGTARARALPLTGGGFPLGVLVALEEVAATGEGREGFEALASVAAAALLLRRYAARTDELGSAIEELERARHEEERVRDLGMLFAEAGPELDAPLESLCALTARIREGLPGDDPNAAVLQIMEDGATRVRRSLASLLEAGRPRPREHRPEDVNRLLADTLTMASGELAEAQVRVSRRLAAQLPPLRLPPDTFRRALLNLLRALLRTVPPEGRLRVESRRAGDHVEILVAADARREPGRVLEGLWSPFLADGRPDDEPSAEIFRRFVHDRRVRLRVYANREWPLVVVLAFPIQASRERRRTPDRRRVS